MSKISLTAASRVGCIRTNNEDMILAYDKMVRSDTHRTEFLTENIDRFIVALADGMGGHLAGEVASEDTLTNLKYFVTDLPKGLSTGELNEMMVEWLNSMNHVIASRGQVDPSVAEMGTTLVGMLYYEGKYFWLNCGDSRLYRLRDGRLLQLSVDHSLNTTKGIKRHSNIITNCIGAGCKTSFIDMYEMTADFLSGDVYMLCSDGLNDMVPDEDIERLMSEGANASQLCEEAIVNGGFDNVSVCVMTVV